MRNLVESQFNERVEVIVADARHVFGESRDAGVNLLARLELQLGEALQFGDRGVLFGGRRILPLVDIQTGSRGPSVKYDTILGCATDYC